MKIVSIDEFSRNAIMNFIIKSWKSDIIVVKGKVHNMSKLSGYVAIENNEIVGLITYCIENNECEIVSLDSINENNGIGSNLIDKVYDMAVDKKLQRIWLITTNDNIRALKFYQRRGFNMKKIYINAVNDARKIKPNIPLIGYYDIPILHEIEFEKEL